MSSIATLLHISDLHFIKALTEQDRSVVSKVMHQGGLAPHDFRKVEALAIAVCKLNSPKQIIDVLLATGDISTDGSEDSLRTALEFLEQDDVYRDTPGQWVTKGLGATNVRRVIVPGNHDRFGGPTWPFQKRSDKLETIFFKKKMNYPYVVGYRKPEERENIEKPALLFFVFDSTASKKTPFKRDLPAKIARGYIDDRACKWLKLQRDEIGRKKEVLGLDGLPLPVDYDVAVRIAVLHHHPINTATNDLAPRLTMSERIAAAQRLSAVDEPKDRWTTLLNRQAFVDSCYEAGIDIVLFGHQHVDLHRFRSPRADGPNNDKPAIHFFCCSSTTQFSEKKNGFYLYRFDEDRFFADFYEWSDDALAFLYEEDKSESCEYSRQISSPRRYEAKA